MTILKKFYKKLPVLIFDIAAIPIAWYSAYWLRYNMHIDIGQLLNPYSLVSLTLLLVLQTVCYYHFKVYRGIWYFSSLNDVMRILKAVIATSILIIPILYLSSLLHHIPRSVLPLYAIILTTLLCSARLAGRLFREALLNQNKESMPRVLIIGAGAAGESIVRDLKRSMSYHPIGFIDDNQTKRGMEIHGVPVLGNLKELVSIVKQYEVELIFIAIPSAQSATMRHIVSYCDASQVPFRTLPSIKALASGKVEINAFREVNLEDLLGRDQVYLEWEKIFDSIKGKRVVVSGGGGSIGSELCRQILALNPAQLLIIDNSEFNLYKIEQELLQNYPADLFQVVLVSITDIVGVRHLFEQYQPQIIFHAAAYKHVPLLEEQLRLAVVNNVIGTKILAEESVKVKAEKFILISSDKAVNPVNVMGTTKRVAEIFCQNLNDQVKTQFITVRFGNVLGSAGSVVPLFQKQIQEGGPVTVTDPNITRYFMTIPEACQLILQASVNGQGGEIFVLDMGEPIRISYLAEQMIRLSGKEIEIEYTGLRPGEKLFEELFHESEQLAQTAHEKLFKAKVRKINWQELLSTFTLIEQACHTIQNEELYLLLKSLVPEFNPSFIKENETEK